MSDSEGFFTRWSRRKAARRSGDAAPEVEQRAGAPHEAQRDAAARASAAPHAALQAARAGPAPRPDAGGTTLPAHTAGAERGAAPPLPTLADAAELAPTSDFSRFVAPGVDASVQHAALKKLFSDPHFNVMDGLDTYIDDYNTPNPIPPAMLARLVHARAFDAPPPAAAAAAPPDAEVAAFPDGANAPALPQSAATNDGAPPGPDTDEDTVVRLQPDDAADAAGAGPHRQGPRA